MQKECPICRKIFSGKSSKLTCSKSCLIEWRKQNKIKTCVNCGKQFIGGSEMKILCSPECKREWKFKTLGQIKICEQCGQEYVGFSFSKYCSSQCKSIVTKEEHQKDNICAYCGKKYMTYEYSDSSYCSHSCVMAALYKDEKITARHSKIHEKIDRLLQSMRLEYIDEYQVGIYTLDIKLLKYNKAIEIMGSYWHADVRRYPQKEILHERQLNCIEKDRRKEKVVCDNGIQILYLWEEDIEKDLDKCKILISNFINDKLLKNHSSSYTFEDFEILQEINIQQYMEISLND